MRDNRGDTKVGGGRGAPLQRIFTAVHEGPTQSRYLLQPVEDLHQSRWILLKELHPVEITSQSTCSLLTARKKMA